MGCKTFFIELKEHIPIVELPIAIVLLVLNIIISGFGTICFICVGGSANWVEHLIIGFIQFFCWIFIVGWIWSICWGIFVVMKSI